MNERFTFLGIIILALVFWVVGVGGNPNITKVINWFLGVLLVSIVSLRWERIKPFIIKSSPPASHGGGSKW